MTGSEQWPAALPVVGVRVARPTDRLEAVVAFYRDGLGFYSRRSYTPESSLIWLGFILT